MSARAQHWARRRRHPLSRRELVELLARRSGLCRTTVAMWLDGFAVPTLAARQFSEAATELGIDVAAIAQESA